MRAWTALHACVLVGFGFRFVPSVLARRGGSKALHACVLVGFGGLQGMAKRKAGGRHGAAKQGADMLRLRKISHCSQSGIAKLCEEIRREGLPEHSSRNTQQRRRKSYCKKNTPCGHLVEDVKDLIPGLTLGVQSPGPMLIEACQKEGFASAMKSQLAKHPMPWRIVAYADGISPADGLTKHDLRKLQAVYYSYLEFDDFLSSEEVWLVFFVVRQNKLPKGVPSLSVLLSQLFDRFFFNNEGGVNFMTTGIDVQVLGTEDIHFKATMGQIVADVPALKDILACKGHAGFRPNPILRNVTLRWLYDASTAQPDDVPHSCTDTGKFKFHTTETLRSLLAWVGAKPPGAERHEASVIAGWDYHPDMFALRPYVDVANMLAFDPMHVYLQGGLLDSELGSLMTALKRMGSTTTYEGLGEYTTLWKWPKHITAPSAKKLFSPEAAKANLKSESFSSGASELLSMVPVLGHYFLHAFAEGARPQHVVCFLALLDVVMLVFAVGECDVDSEVLARFQARHLDLKVEVYGKESLKPKDNYSLMLPRQLKEFGGFVRTFVHERHHKLAKHYGYFRKNAVSFEVGMMEDVTVDQLMMMESTWHKRGAQGYSEARPAVKRSLKDLHPDADTDPLVARVWRTERGNTITIGDVAIFEHEGGLEFGEVVIMYHFELLDYAIVFHWERCGEQPYVDAARLLARQRPLRIRASCLVTALIVSDWKPEQPAIVLLPLQYR